MKRYGFMFLLSILVVAVQQAVFSRISLFNVSVDIAFVYIICFSLVRDEIESVAIALFTGILRDSFFPGVFGINTVLFLITAYIACQIQKRIFKDAIVIPMLLTLAFTALKSMLYFAFFYIIGIRFDFRQHVLYVLALESVYNSLISIAIYNMVKIIGRTGMMYKDWRF